MPEAVITSRTNARVKQLRAAFAMPAEAGLLAIEGEHLLAEAIRSGLHINTVFVGERRALPADLDPRSTVLRLADDVLRSALPTESPQMVAALVERPLWEQFSLQPGDSPLILVAAGLQDPGNLGTLIRSAEAFGATGVLTTPGTVNVWNPKCVRASVGSVFRVPVQQVSLEVLTILQQQGLRLFAAVAQNGVTAPAAEMLGATGLMIGNEGAGLSDALLAMADVRVTIPCPGEVESLNAAIAGSLLLYEASRQRTSAEVPR